MKKELAGLVLARIVNHAAADNTAEVAKQPTEPENPTQHHEETMIVASRGRKFDLAPHLTGTRERRRAAEAGAAIELELP